MNLSNQCDSEKGGRGESQTKPDIKINVSATHFNASCNCSGNYAEVPPIGSIAYNSSNVYPCYCPISNRLPPSANPGDVDNYCKQFNDNKKCC